MSSQAVFALAPVVVIRAALEVGFERRRGLVGALKGIFKRYEGMTQTRPL